MQVKLRNPERVVEVKGPKTVGAVHEELEDEGSRIDQEGGAGTKPSHGPWEERGLT
jgi:hypothetical protein